MLRTQNVVDFAVRNRKDFGPVSVEAEKSSRYSVLFGCDQRPKISVVHHGEREWAEQKEASDCIRTIR